MTKKNFVVGLAAVAMLPIAASAATVEELQAQINALMAQLSAAKPATTASCSAAFSKTLKQGMTDAEVMDLQKVLNSDVATQVAASGVGSAGNETKYFGAATKAAVVKFQDKYAAEVLTPAGLSKGTGLVGAATRAKLNALCSATTGTTGTTGNTTTPSTGLQGGAGTITVNYYSSDVEDIVVTGDSEIVSSFKAEASGSDLKITHLKLSLAKQADSASTYLNRYFTSFDVYAAGKKVGSIDAADFTRDSAGKYSKTVALTDAVVKMGSSNKVVFTIKANAVASIDTENVDAKWDLSVSDLRYTDATGVILTEATVDGTNSGTNIVVEKLASSSDVKVKISSGSTNPDEKTVFISDDSSGDKVTMNEFKVKAEGTKVAFDTVKVSFAGSKNLPVIVSELQLVKGDTVVETFDPTSATSTGIATFDLDDQQYVNQDETVTYKIVAKMQKINAGSFVAGDKLAVSFLSVNAEDKNGDLISSSKISGSSTGKDQTFRATGIALAKVSSTATAVAKADTANGYGKFTMDVKVTASGDDLWVPLTSVRGTATSGITYVMEDSTGATVSSGTTTAVVTRVSGGTIDGNYVKVADGETAQLKITVSYDPAANGFARLQVSKVGYALSAVAPTATIDGTPTTDFETDSVDIRI